MTTIFVLRYHEFSPPEGAEGVTHAWPRSRLITGFFWGGEAKDPPCVTAVERHAVPRAPLSPLEYQLNTSPPTLTSHRRTVLAKATGNANLFVQTNKKTNSSFVALGHCTEILPRIAP